MDNFNLKKYLAEGRLFEDETTPSRDEMFDDFEKMAKDLKAKTGADIIVVKFPNQFRFHVNDYMMGWWGGQKDIFVARNYPSPEKVKQAYDAANEWVSTFPERYADYLSWKEKGEEAFEQEVNRRRKKTFGE
jgi:ABC-type glycerol-3-phosphate transport system substrate-binding protein